jgi:branched-subunit amino acid ABC-type transport system permease component
MNHALQLLVDGLVQGSRIALVAAGFSLIYGVTRTLHLAHGAILTLSAYLVWWMTAKVGSGLLLAFLAAGVVAMLLGAAHDVFLYRRIRAATTGGFTMVVASLGTGIVIQNLAGILFGFDTKDMRTATVGQATAGLPLGPVVLPLTDLITLGVTLVLFALLGFLLLRTRMGKQLRAVQDNPQLARVVGVRAPRVYAWTFALGSLVSMPAAFFIGLSGGLNTTIGFDAMLLALIVVFAGGIGSLLGTLLASFGVGILQTMSLLVVDSRWEAAVTFALLLLLVTLRPRGLLGKAS